MRTNKIMERPLAEDLPDWIFGAKFHLSRARKGVKGAIWKRPMEEHWQAQENDREQPNYYEKEAF